LELVPEETARVAHAAYPKGNLYLSLREQLSTFKQLSRRVIDYGNQEESMQPLQLPIPTEEQLTALDELYRTTREVRLRTRAQMVFWAVEQHLTAPAIAVIVREDDQTVRRWLKRWVAQGIEGLRDRPMPGPPPTITEEYQEHLLAVVRRRPRSVEQPSSLWTLRRLSDYMAEHTGIRASYETVRLVLKAGDMVLSRPQHTISSPDAEYQVKKRRLQRPAIT
jgi:transposase